MIESEPIQSIKFRPPSLEQLHLKELLDRHEAQWRSGDFIVQAIAFEVRRALDTDGDQLALKVITHILAAPRRICLQMSPIKLRYFVRTGRYFFMSCLVLTS